MGVFGLFTLLFVFVVVSFHPPKPRAGGRPALPPLPDADAAKRCRSCGAGHPAFANFCRSCGGRL